MFLVQVSPRSSDRYSALFFAYAYRSLIRRDIARGGADLLHRHVFVVVEDDDEPLVAIEAAGHQAHQIANVLRLKAGEEIVLVRNGVESQVLIERVSAEEYREKVRDVYDGREAYSAFLKTTITALSGYELAVERKIGRRIPMWGDAP